MRKPLLPGRNFQVDAPTSRQEGPFKTALLYRTMLSNASLLCGRGQQPLSLADAAPCSVKTKDPADPVPLGYVLRTTVFNVPTAMTEFDDLPAQGHHQPTLPSQEKKKVDPQPALFSPPPSRPSSKRRAEYGAASELNLQRASKARVTSGR